MNRIIGDLLTFARPASLNRVALNLKELLEGCLETVLRASGGEGRLTVTRNIQEISASLDEVLARQAFSNLMQNAVEAMPDTGKLEVSATGTGSEVWIRVGDNGPGIAPDVVKKIFLPFFTTKDKGVGMGLALVHKIVASHGGRIEVESGEGKGTVFTVILPKG